MSDSSTPADHSLVPTSDLSSDVLVAVGRIIGAHGREGEIRVKATSDVPGRFDEGQTLYVSRDGVSPEERTYQIAKTRSTGSKGKDILIISLRGCRDRDQALRMAGLWPCVLQSEVSSAEEGRSEEHTSELQSQA